MKLQNSFMKPERNSFVVSTVTWPSSSIRPGVNSMYASIAFICGELQKLRCSQVLLRNSSADFHGGYKNADGLRVNEFCPTAARHLWRSSPKRNGRVYSGVTEQPASTSAMIFNARWWR